MKTGNYKALTFFILMIIIVTLIFFVFIYNKEYKLNFEKVTEIQNSELVDKLPIYWCTIRNKEYNGYFGSELPSELDINMDLNLDKYTYIITLGHELQSISYSYKETKNRKLLFFPKQYIGKVLLLKNKTPYIYIYRIKKMDIDSDIHEPDKNVCFVN